VIFDVYDSDLGKNEPAWRCSGSLLSSTLVLTAGHCTKGAVAARVWFDEDLEENTEYPLSGGTSYEGEPFTYPNDRDVGVVVLSESVLNIVVSEYADLPDSGFVDTLENKESIDLVGYGVQWREKGSPPPFIWSGDDLVRLTAPSEIVGELGPSDEFIRIALNPGGGSGGVCFGDSGGPDLLSGTNTVLAVNSFGNQNCAGVGYSTRVDNLEVLNWIEAHK
jgi:hypothetical protein